MTTVGEVRSGRHIGYSGGCWGWCACVDCGVARWVLLTRGVPTSIRCRSCGVHHFYLEHPGASSGSNHSMWGKKHSPESIEKMRQAHRGHCPTSETREKLRLASLGNKYSLGQVQSAETKAKRVASNRRIAEERGYWITDAHKEMLRQLHLGSVASAETRNRLRVSHTGYKHTPEQTRKIADKNRGRKVSRDTVERIRDIVRATWANYSVENKNRRVAVTLRAMSDRPNRVESILLGILLSVSSDWRYTGDGSLVVGGKNPDYWNGDHKVIEMFGDYWHRGENPQDRIDFFDSLGYSCLVLWEHDIYDNPDVVRCRIVAFSGRSNSE